MRADRVALWILMITGATVGGSIFLLGGSPYLPAFQALFFALGWLAARATP